MIAAFDVHYDRSPVKGVMITFNWGDNQPVVVTELYFDRVEAYQPGEFYRRELPCILTLIEQQGLDKIDCLLIDGFVWLGENKKGLGAHLYDHLGGKVPVIGVAKTNFSGADQVCFPVYRGTSKNPLWVSSVGFPAEEAANQIKNMRGEFRIPLLLKELDRLTRT